MKNFVIGLLALLCVGLIIKVLFFPSVQVPVVSDDNSVAVEAKKTVGAQVANINNKVNKNGFQVAVAADKQSVIQSVNQLDDSSRYWFEKYAEQVGINSKQAKLLMTASTTISALELAAIETDTGYYYRDKWAYLEYIRPKDSISKGHFNFTYNADVNYAEYYKRSWFLGPKKHYIDFWLSDPRATVNGMKRIRVEPKEKLIKLDVNAAAFYTDRLNAGVDAGFHLGRTRLGGGYFYDLSEQNWKPVFTVKFKLLEL